MFVSFFHIHKSTSQTSTFGTLSDFPILFLAEISEIWALREMSNWINFLSILQFPMWLYLYWPTPKNFNQFWPENFWWCCTSLFNITFFLISDFEPFPVKGCCDEASILQKKGFSLCQKMCDKLKIWRP